MKKFLSVSIIFAIIAILLSGCENKLEERNSKDGNDIISEQTTGQVNVDNLYMMVLNNEMNYISEDNEEKLFSEYMESYNESITDVKVEYSIIDVDADNENEMVIMIEAYSDGFYLILNHEDGKIYGFNEVYRGMMTPKKDGTFMYSGGAMLNGVAKNTYSGTKKYTENIAENDEGIFRIDGSIVSESEYLKYIEEFNEKENIDFITYIESYDFNNNSSENTENNIDTSENISKTFFTEGTYTMTKPSLVGSEAEGYDTTMTFKDGKVNYFESYWEQRKSGTYTVTGDTLTINFTTGNEVSSIEGDLGDKSINETEIYKIEESTLTIQSMSRDQYTKAGDIIFELK